MPINFDLKKVRDDYELTTFFETGLWKGNTLKKALAAGFEKVVSIEVSEYWVEFCKQRFKDDSRVHLIHDDSQNIADHLHIASGGTFYWLDAHADQPQSHKKGAVPCPVYEELEAIEPLLTKRDILAVDDMRIIKSDSGWGKGVGFEKLLAKINSMGDYEIEFLDGHIENDVLVAFPKT